MHRKSKEEGKKTKEESEKKLGKYVKVAFSSKLNVSLRGITFILF